MVVVHVVWPDETWTYAFYCHLNDSVMDNINDGSCVEVSGCSVEGIKSEPLCTIDNGPYTISTIGCGTITGYDVSGFGGQSASSCCTAAGGLLSRNYFCACALLQ